MMRTICLIAAALAACSPQSQSPNPDAGTTAIGTPTEAYDLRGPWTISRLDGQALEYRIAFNGGPGALTWEPGCAGQGIRYRTVGDTLEFYQPPSTGPREVCDIGYPEDLPRVIDALEGRWQVIPQENGNLRLSRDGNTIVLEKTAEESVGTLEGAWRVAGIDGEPFDEPYGIALSADGEEIWWEPRCAGQSVRYRIVNERFIVVEDPPSPPPAPGSDAPPARAVCAIGLPPRLPEIMSAIRAADRIERTPQNGLLLSGNGRRVTLFSQ